MYIYMRKLSCKRIASFTGACIYMFSGSIMQNMHNLPILQVITWIPLVFALTETYFVRTEMKRGSMRITTLIYADPKRKFIILTALVFILQIFAGHIQFFYYTVLFFVPYVILRFPHSLWSKIKFTFATLSLAAILGVVQLLPFLEFVRQSTRPEHDLSFALSGSPTIPAVAHLILAQFFGRLKDGTTWGVPITLTGYVGILPFLLTFILFVKKSNRLHKVLLFLLLLAFFLSLGKYSPLYHLAFWALPFFSRFRTPTSILSIYTFFFVALAGCGLDQILASKKRIHWPTVATYLTLPIFAVAVLFRFFGFPLFVSFLHIGQAFHPFSRLIEYPLPQLQTIYLLWTQNFTVVLGIFFFFFLLLTLRKKFSSLVFALLLALVPISDVIFFGNNMKLTSDPSIVNQQTPLSGYLEKNLHGQRILTINDPPFKAPFADASYFDHEAIKSFYSLKVNLNEAFGIPSMDGYASIVSSHYINYLGKKNDFSPTEIVLPDLGGNRIDELGVKYIIAGDIYDGKFENIEKYKPVTTYDVPVLGKRYRIYENISVKPRAFVLDPREQLMGETKVDDVNVNEVKVAYQIPKDGLLVLMDTFYPGWIAYKDGKEVAIVSYKGNFRSVAVPAGHGEVVFRFEPASVKLGAIISGLGLVILLFLFLR